MLGLISYILILLYPLSSYIKFRVTNGVKMVVTNKLLFVLMSDCRESMIAFLYLDNLFEDPHTHTSQM